MSQSHDQKVPHIALIRQTYTPFGGAERFLAQAVDGLVQSQSARVTVISRRWDAETDGGFQRMRCNPFHIGRLWRDRGFARKVCRMVSKGGFDLIQSHERIPCCHLYRAGDGVHREWLRQREREGGGLTRLLDKFSPYHRYVMEAERRMFTSPTLRAVICNSRMVKEEIQDYFGVAAEKLHVIYNCVDHDYFHPGLAAEHRARVRGVIKVPEDAPLFLFIGSGYRRKGLPYLFSAMTALPPEARLLVVGKDRWLRDFMAITRGFKIEDRVVFAGPMEDTRACYGAVDAVVLPTHYDPFPNVALEAMACGLPFITSFKSGASDLIRHGENGLLMDSLDVDGLVDNMRALLDPDTRKRIGDAGRETVLPLTRTRMVGEMMALYQALLNP